jgi:glyoxylase-like metal-dependent hydrolase (beta-lactamase superfamily II)
MKETEKLAKSAARHDWFTVAPGVWGLRDVFVNLYMIHNERARTWVLVDAGLKTSATKIRRMAQELFWPDSKPSAIVLTHGHFDHVGSLRMLAEEWNVPVYAHELERPFLLGKCAYPPPDPTVGGGMMAYSSFMYPKGPIDLGDRLQELPEDGKVPGLPGWTWLHTPGHSPGHVSLFRKRDKVLIAGDAFVTTRQESLLAVARQSKILSGPPKYFTCDWDAAADSVRLLAGLEPEIAATGHGKPMQGEDLRRRLHDLADHFETVAVPTHGRYVDDPAVTNEEGVSYVPAYDRRYRLALQLAGLAASAALLYWWSRKPKQRARLAFIGSKAARLVRRTAADVPPPGKLAAIGQQASSIIDQVIDKAEAALPRQSKKVAALGRRASEFVGDATEKVEKALPRQSKKVAALGRRASDFVGDTTEKVEKALPHPSKKVASLGRQASRLVGRLTDNGQGLLVTALDLIEDRLTKAKRAVS